MGWPDGYVVAHKGVEKLIAVFILSAILIFIALISNKIQRNRRIEVVTFFLSIPLALLIGEGVVEKLILVSSVCFIIFIEITNSAIEAAIDRVLPKCHVPDDWLLTTKRPLLHSRQVLQAVVATWQSSSKEPLC